MLETEKMKEKHNKRKRIYPLSKTVVKVIIFCCLILHFTLHAQETEETPLDNPEISNNDLLSSENTNNSPVLEQTAVDTQEEKTLSDDELKAAGKLTSAERQRIELEIKTSTLPELAVWCRTLGLSEGGTRNELASRIRDHFNLPAPKEQADSNQKIITIESAQSTEYFTIEVVDEDYARLKGDVSLILTDKDARHSIKADEILFNRTRNTITARGKVIYTKDKDGTIDTFRGENITVNIDDWKSIFLDGTSEKSLESDNTTYRFAGSVISRSNEDDVMILKDAVISNAKNEEALWSISASKLWLLPGSDFAIFNAVLNVGEIPVLYIPFFYFPADEVIFHPVIGYRSREGGFIQTTTYIMGRPKVNQEDKSSLSRIMGNSNDMEKKHNGLFLKSTGKKKVDPNEISLKALLDYYTNLGIYLGVDFSMPKKGILDPLEFSIGIGFTRTISQINGDFNPFAPKYDGTYDWNHSNLFSASVPFRYRLKTKSAISGKYGSLSWDFPYYSDPFVDKDLLTRSESMDWMNMIQQGAAVEEETILATDIITSIWTLQGRVTPSLNILAPYISNISLSNISTSLSFKTITDKEILANNKDAPGRSFFVPDKYTIYSVTGSISGTPLTIGGAPRSAAVSEKQEIKDPLKDIGVPRSPWPKEEEETLKTDQKTPEDKLIPPALTQRFDLPSAGNLKFSIDYQMTPTSSSELQFMSGYDHWESYDKVDWSDIQSIITTIGGNASLNLRLDHSGNLFSNTVSFTGNGTWVDYSYINEEAEAYRTPPTPNGVKDNNKVEEARKQQYSKTNYTTSYSYNGTLRPLYQNSIFSQSTIQYNFGGTLVRSKRYSNGSGPELAPQWGAWVKQETKNGEDIPGLTSHKLSSSIAANIMDKQQNITFSMDLPPFDSFISTSAAFRFWISETTARISFKKPEMIDNAENNEWKIEPFYLSETLRFGTSNTLTFQMTLEPEKNNEITSISSTLSLWKFRASYYMGYTQDWEFVLDNQGGRWEAQGEYALHPTRLSFNFDPSFPQFDIIRNRLNISFNVSSLLDFNLQKYTESKFTFSTGLILGIPGFLELRLSASSKNSVIWRYFKKFPGLEKQTSMYIDGDQNNVFIDLFDSFNFGNEAKRKRSGFKMEGFNIKATHFLGDWKAELDVIISPWTDPNIFPPKPKLNTDISFLVQWTPISEIKTDIGYNEKYTNKWIKK